MRIYDCFMFRDELDMLELRLNVLSPVVDYFVLVESPESHTRQPKPLVYAENRSRFLAFADKIIQVVDDASLPPETNVAATHLRETSMRNSIVKGLTSAHDDDLVMISDLDEIINPGHLSGRPLAAILDSAHQNILRWHMLFYYYYLDCRLTVPPLWCVSLVTSWRHLQTMTPWQARLANRTTDGAIPHGGWHFSFLGGPEAICHKLAAYTETFYNQPPFTNPEWVADHLEKARDLWDRNQVMGFVKEFDYLPQYIQQHAEHYWKLGWFRYPPPGVAGA